MDISYFKVYKDFIGIARELDNGARGRLFLAILQYVNDEEPDNLTGAEKIAFLTMKSQIDRDAATYDDVSEKRRKAGQKGAKKRWSAEEDIANASFAILPYSKNSNCHQDKEKDKDKEEDKDKDEEKDKKEILPNGSTKKKFVPPTLEEVAAYVRERGSNVIPQVFIDFYQQKGWMVGKTPMKDWKAACRNAESWERWDKGKPPRAGKQAPPDDKPEEPDEAEIERLRRNLRAMRGEKGDGEE